MTIDVEWWIAFAIGLTAGTVATTLATIAGPLYTELRYRWETRRIIAKRRKRVYGEDMKR